MRLFTIISIFCMGCATDNQMFNFDKLKPESEVRVVRPAFEASQLYLGTELTYTQTQTHIFVQIASSVGVGVSAPTNDESCDFLGKAFDITDEGYIAGNALPCWDEETDIFFRFVFFPQQGDPFQVGETVIVTYTYRSKNLFESVNGGTQAVASTTYTQVTAPSLDCQQLFVDVNLDKDDADQPYDTFDGIFGSFTITGTYSGDPVLGSVVQFIAIDQPCHQG